MQLKIGEIKEWLIKNAKWIILFVSIIAFLALVEDVWDKDIDKLDVIGYKIISTTLISDFMTPVAKFITNLGSATFLILVAMLSVLLIKNKKIGISVCSNLAVAAVLNFLLKNILQRPRPTEFRIIDENGYSFPSGHSMVSMAFYGFIIYLIYKYVKKDNIKWPLIILLGALILFIGVSRIYLGVHYTSDVLGGFLISISYLIIYISIVKKVIK